MPLDGSMILQQPPPEAPLIEILSEDEASAVRTRLLSLEQARYGTALHLEKVALKFALETWQAARGKAPPIARDSQAEPS